MSAHQELLDKLEEMNKRLDSIDAKVNPMYDLFTNTRGFGNMSIWILKGLIMLGGATAVVYGLIRWLKSGH